MFGRVWLLDLLLLTGSSSGHLLLRVTSHTLTRRLVTLHSTTLYSAKHRHVVVAVVIFYLVPGTHNTCFLPASLFFIYFFSKGRNKARYCVYICFFLGTNTHARTPVLGVGCHISVCNSTKTQSHMHTVEGYCSCCWAQGDLRRTSSSAVPVASLHEQMSFIQ